MQPWRLAGVTALLDAAPELAVDLSGAELEPARLASRVRVVAVPGPAWRPDTLPARPGWLGLFVIEGLLLRRVQVGARAACELLSAGDLIRPWDQDGGYDPLPVDVDWIVLSPARVGVLDESFARRIARWPAVHAQLMARMIARPRQLTVLQAVTHLPRTHLRLLVALWLLAERWGRVTPEGVVVRLPLTHRVLAMLIGCHRPTVTLALRKLVDSELVVRQARDRWVLTHRAIDYLKGADGWMLAGATPAAASPGLTWEPPDSDAAVTPEPLGASNGAGADAMRVMVTDLEAPEAPVTVELHGDAEPARGAGARAQAATDAD